MQHTLGTKAQFRSWLESKKHMTYSKYSTMLTKDKLVIQKEYKGK